MPNAKDITGDIGKLPSKKLHPRGLAPTMPQPHLERKLAFNAISFVFWMLIGVTICMQIGFMAWLF